jgi:hypothetical protein
VISDYLATHAKLNLDGLIFRSAQVPASEKQAPAQRHAIQQSIVRKEIFQDMGVS